MGLGPRLDIRQSQSLVLTPQLTQAIKLLALSNLELEAVVAEELAKNPLLEATTGEGEEAGASVSEAVEAERGEPSDDAPDDPGTDDLIAGLNANEDQPLDIDWSAAALETDSFADVAGSAAAASGGEEGFDFDRLEYAAGSLSEHLLDQLHGAGGEVGQLARTLAHMLDETGYLSIPVADIAEATGRRAI